MCIVSLVAPWILAKIMGYHIGEAVGLLAGSQTISAVIGVASDTINQLGISEAQKATYINAIPVSYAVTYISVRLVLPGFWLLSVRNFSADWIK